MSINLRGRLLAATVCVAAVGGVAAPAGAETLADAIALAYQNNPTLQAQRATQRVLDETYVQARTGWRPTMGVSGGWTYGETATPRVAAGAAIDRNGDGIPDTNTRSHFSNVRAGVSFSQPIWTGGRVAAAVNAANADVLAGRENLRRVEAQVLISVIQAYADTRRDLETVRIRQENVNVLTRQLQESQARFDVGEVTRTDVAQSQARLSQAQALLASATAQLAITRAGYATVVGQNPGELAPEPTLGFMLPSDPDDAFKVAEEFNPQLRAQRFTEMASRARVAGARAERLPTVAAQAGLEFRNQNADDVWAQDFFSRGTTLGVNVSMPLFTGGLINSRVRQAVERNNADRITIEGVRRNVLQGVTQFWSQLIASRANIASSEEQVRAARIAAEGTRQEQQVGLRTTIDVLNAEQELRQAELNAVTSRRDEYVAAANVLAIMGRLEGRNLIPSQPQYDAGKNFRKLRMTWGWVPWEEAVGAVDQVATPWPSAHPSVKAEEQTMAPGLEPAPVTPAKPAPR